MEEFIHQEILRLQSGAITFSASSQVELPLRAGNNAVLQVSHHLQNSLGQLSSSLLLVDGDFVGFALVDKRLNGRDDGCGTSTESLIYTLLLAGFHKLLDLEGFCGDLKFL